MNRTLTFSCTAVFAAVLPALADPPYTITRSVIATGGGSSAGGIFSVTGTVGETAAGSGVTAGGKFDLASGFWAFHPAVMWPAPRSLGVEPAIVSGNPGYAARVEWTPSRNGWRVESSPDLLQWTHRTNTLSGADGNLTLAAAGPVPPRLYWRLVRL